MTRVLTQRWELVNSLSSVGFAARNFGLKTVRGTVPLHEAWVDVDEHGRPMAVHAELDLAGLDTGNTRRDRDLRKPHLLSTEKFRTVTFTGRAGEPDEDGWQVPGRLAARGTEIDVVLATTIASRTDQVSVHATTQFDRRDLGVRAPRVMIGRIITVTIDAVLRPA
jgi:polyisoprenoid-binding protein YceI